MEHRRWRAAGGVGSTRAEAGEHSAWASGRDTIDSNSSGGGGGVGRGGVFALSRALASLWPENDVDDTGPGLNIEGVEPILDAGGGEGDVEEGKTRGSEPGFSRCFIDPRRSKGKVQRCRANVYFFGVSKCGECL